jgi:hypothetical protein
VLIKPHLNNNKKGGRDDACLSSQQCGKPKWRTGSRPAQAQIQILISKITKAKGARDPEFKSQFSKKEEEENKSSSEGGSCLKYQLLGR